MRRVDVNSSELARFSVSSGDLLFARRSLVASGAGKCSMVLEANEPTVFESSIIRARPRPEIADSAFLFYLFRSPLGVHKLDTILRHVAVAGITGKDLEALELPCPPISEQRAIAHILGTLDDKIELNRRMNETLEAMARAIFQSWFVNFDPVHAKARGEQPAGMSDDIAALFPTEFEDSELGPIPKGWRVATVGREFSVTMGQSPPGHTYNSAGEGVPLYQGRTDFGFRFPTPRICCNAPTRLAAGGDTLVSVRAPVGSVNMANEGCCVGRGVAAARHVSGSRSYTYYSMLNLQPQFARFEAEGTVFGSINKSDFNSLLHVGPPPELVKVFERIAAPIDEKIDVGERQSLALIELRDTLLPRLISGKLRVPDAERLVADAIE
jgi:type I restriction enzyme S subunit